MEVNILVVLPSFSLTFIRDPAHFFQSEGIRVIVTTEPTSAADCVRTFVSQGESVSAGNVPAEDNQDVAFDRVQFISDVDSVYVYITNISLLVI